MVVEIHYYRMATLNFDWNDFESRNFLDIEIKGDIRLRIDQNTLIKLPVGLYHSHPFWKFTEWFFFMFLQINIVMNNFGSSKFEQDEEIFESKNRKFIRDKIGEWRIQNGIIPDYKIRGHERK